ncbi:MAG: hypothetical protein ACRDRS_27095 [Pseudonocardiaceae bacterium]
MNEPDMPPCGPTRTSGTRRLPFGGAAAERERGRAAAAAGRSGPGTTPWWSGTAGRGA